ncbi:hypothetical protein GGR54DRAFT_638549 [Hypoxylon sp. NC1633]|nr:hypothetical protein GGR54DRAFT_638549 [Hypoxylon sp. NC1633]
MLSRSARHLAPLRTLATRQPTYAQPAAIQLQLRGPSRARFSSTSTSQQEQPQSSPERPSPNAQFYKTFGRPIAKVFLLAIFTYQLAYYFWVRLEQDEIKSEMRGT